MLRAASGRTVAGGRAAVVVQEMRGRECLLVLHTHDEKGPANAVISHACFVGSRIAMSGW